MQTLQKINYFDRKPQCSLQASGKILRELASSVHSHDLKLPWGRVKINHKNATLGKSEYIKFRMRLNSHSHSGCIAFYHLVYCFLRRQKCKYQTK